MSALWVRPAKATTKSPPCRIALHAARVGGSAAAAAFARSGGEAALGPIGLDLDNVASALELLDGRLRHAAFEHQHARARLARPERGWKMLGMPCGRIDRLLQVEARVDVA